MSASAAAATTTTTSSSEASPPTAAGAPASSEAHLPTPAAPHAVEDSGSSENPLPPEEHSHAVDVKTGDVLSGPVTKPESARHDHILVAIDPDSAQGQSEKAMETALKVVKPGDTVILLTVLPSVLSYGYGLAGGYGGTYDVQWQIDTLRKLRYKEMLRLQERGKLFGPDVKVVAQVVHGGIEGKILAVAEANTVDLIILGKRKLGRWEKMLTTSVTNYISSHAGCSVLVAK